MLALLVVATLVGCSQTARQSPDVSDSIRKSLDQAGLKDVSVSQDRDKGVVTLGGHVAADADKSQAESIAKSIAIGQVVANQIAVMPPGGESEAKAVNSDLDQGIEKNLDAALIRNKLQKSVKYDVKNGVVTLNGEVNSQSKRAQAEQIASAVPNVKQVVNDLQIGSRRARSRAMRSDHEAVLACLEISGGGAGPFAGDSGNLSSAEVLMLWTMFVILLILWLLGFSFHIAGGLIHLLLVIAVVVLVINLISGRRTA